MILSGFQYVTVPGFSGELTEDVAAFMEANGRPKTLGHMRDVAEMSLRIGRMHGLDLRKCEYAALMHDISAVIKPGDMLEYAKVAGMELCEAEERFPFLLHQRMSEIVAREYFGITDREILSAISVHTTLRAHADEYDMTLFIADKLAWDQEGTPPFYDKVYSLLDDLPSACIAYMEYMQDSGKLLCPHTLWTEGFEYLAARRK